MLSTTNDSSVRPIGEGLVRTVVVIAALVLLLTSDLAVDIRANLPLRHIVLEVSAGGLLLWAMGSIVARLRRARAGLHSLEGQLREAHSVLADRASHVERQFDAWRLTAAERQVALLLLRGLRHKEIADVRGTGERTVRQQALGVYKKAGLEGRTELAGLFFDRLLAPAP